MNDPMETDKGGAEADPAGPADRQHSEYTARPNENEDQAVPPAIPNNQKPPVNM